jgi:hypothetical protein
MMKKLTGSCWKITVDSRPRSYLKQLQHAGALITIFLVLVGCSPEEASAHLRRDLSVDLIEIVHVRFPCWSPDMYFFSYRFRARSNR